ncbi:MAG: GNAT family N-acetyltransferase, partial [Oscillospiraceae bacterium]|nr:GNAT family N-acetyltransferase [Oscillospiraceae bacterium]
MKLTKPVAYRKATIEDLDNIQLIIRQAKNYLKKHRVDQWQSEYPTEELLQRDIERGEGYVVTYGERFAGYFVLSERRELDYDELMDGKWRCEEPYCVLHRLAVMAEFRGSGMADRIMGFAEELTKAAGRSYVRIDTHKKNKAMTALLRAHGYEYRGNLIVFCEPYHDPKRQAFDKMI